MKFIYTILLVLVIFSATINSIQIKKESENSHLLDFFNDLYPSHKKERHSETSKLAKSRFKSRSREDSSSENYKSLESSYARFVQSNNATNASDAAPEVKILEAWMNISSYDFADEKRYPLVMLPQEGKYDDVKVDRNRFRINLVKTTDINKPNLSFFFRMNAEHIYYSCDNNDMNVVGAIDLTTAKVVKKARIDDRCLELGMKNDVDYSICAVDKKTRDTWYCEIAKKLKIVDNLCLRIEDQKANFKPEIEIEQKVYQPIILIPEASEECNKDFNYRKRGSDWECTCSEGKEQSPINIDHKKTFPSQAAPVFVFDEVDALSPITSLDGTMMAREHIKIKYYREAIRIFHTKFGKVVTLDGTVYHAEEIVFHTPSEHMIDGIRSEMEMQVICYGQTKGDIAKQVVVSFLFEKKAGVYNKFIDDVDFFNLPNKGSPEKNIVNNLNLNKILYSTDSNEMVTFKPISLYTYQGSISFPPCTERTINYVVKEPIPIASACIEMLKEALRESEEQLDGEIENIRDIQPLNERDVYFYDASNCKTPKLSFPKIAPAGHYEKVKKKVTEYFFVNGEEPSGLPDSFVVTENEARGIPEVKKMGDPE